MEAATLKRMPRSGPVQVGVVASLLVVAAGAWAVTGDRMGGMDAGPGTELGGLGWFAVVWVTMMAAMMLPSIAPMVLAHARAQIAATPAFVGGYLFTWAAVGILGYALVEGCGRWISASSPGTRRDRTSRAARSSPRPSTSSAR
jgi:predicted metal-binding integral membrane protein DUF2182